MLPCLRILRCVIIGGAITSAFNCQAADQPTNHGRIVYVAWECSVYARMAEKTESQEKLFNLGLASGRTFIEQVETKQIDEEYVRKNVPIGTTMTLFGGGPTADFLLGRLYENVSTYAYDKTVKEDNTGVSLEVSKWIMDANLRKLKASNKYMDSNCELIQNFSL